MAKLKTICQVILLSSFSVGCAQAPDEPDVSRQVYSTSIQAGGAEDRLQNFAAFEVRWPKVSTADVAKRVGVAIEMLTGGDVSAEVARSRLPKQLPENFGLRLAEEEGYNEAVVLRYYAEVDELRASNVTLQDDIESPVDVGETAARALFEEAFRDFGRSGLLDETQYELGNAEMSRTLTAGGSTVASTPLQEVVNTYDFLARRAINGVPFVNQGVQIAIHRGGRVARIRMGGAQPVTVRATREPALEQRQIVKNQSLGETTADTLSELPGGDGFVFAAKVDSSKYKARFTEDYPKGVADWSQIMYMLPMSHLPSDGGVVVEPMFIFSYSSLFAAEASRRNYVGYSLKSQDAAPIDLSEKANPDAEGDARR